MVDYRKVPTDKEKVTGNGTSSRPDRIPGEQQTHTHRSSSRSLLKHATGWAGDDLDQLFQKFIRADVKESRMSKPHNNLTFEQSRKKLLTQMFSKAKGKARKK